VSSDRQNESLSIVRTDPFPANMKTMQTIRIVCCLTLITVGVARGQVPLIGPSDGRLVLYRLDGLQGRYLLSMSFDYSEKVKTSLVVRRLKGVSSNNRQSPSAVVSSARLHESLSIVRTDHFLGGELRQAERQRRSILQPRVGAPAPTLGAGSRCGPNPERVAARTAAAATLTGLCRLRGVNPG